MVKMITSKCPECGASLDVASDKSRSQYFCHYCGARILIDDGSTTHTHIYREIDEARILEAEVRLRELEARENRRVAARKGKILKVVALSLLGFIGILLMVIALFAEKASNDLVVLFGPGLIIFDVAAWIAIATHKWK